MPFQFETADAAFTNAVESDSRRATIKRDLAFDFDTGTFVRANGQMTFTVDQPAIQQSVTIRLQFFLGEWFLDTTKGLPWLQDILVKSPDLVTVEAAIRKQIEETPGIVTVTLVATEFDRSTRVLSVEWAATTDLGVLADTFELTV